MCNFYKLMKGRLLNVGSDFCGVGAFNQALIRRGISYKEEFACDFNYYARMTFIANYGTESDLYIAKSLMHKIYANGMEKIALGDLGSKSLLTLLNKAAVVGETIDEKILDFRNKANSFAKEFSFYYPFDVYDREIPTDSLDIYMTSPPCQAFSLAGKREGEDSVKGVLFYNSHAFIKINKPRFFIFENVKGLLSDDKGKTFKKWIDYLGGKSVNGVPTFFTDENSVPYHVYYKVLNAKHYNIPQNRERIFIIGIRDDEDNSFVFPEQLPLEKRLKDVLEEVVDESYYLSEKMTEQITFLNKSNTEHSHTITTRINESSLSWVRVKSANKKGYELAEVGEDSINLEQPNSKTRRGRVGKSVAQTLTTGCSQGFCDIHYRIRKLTPTECFRLMDFPDTLIQNARKKVGMSNSQLYKQAGNSIAVGVLDLLINNLLKSE